VPGIHVFAADKEDVDGRDKPGHDESNQFIEQHQRYRKHPWPSSSPKNNPCCGTVRAA